MSSLPPTHPPLVASVPDVDNASCASLFLGHPLLHFPQCAVIICIGVHLALWMMSAFRCRTHIRRLDVVSTQVALLLIPISHVLLGFTRARSEVFTNKLRFTLSTLITQILPVPVQMSQCLFRWYVWPLNVTCVHLDINLNVTHRCYTYLQQWFKQCGSQTGSTSITWMHMPGPDLRPPGSETLGVSPQQCFLICPGGDSGACPSVRPTDTDATHPHSDDLPAVQTTSLLLQVILTFSKLLHMLALRRHAHLINSSTITHWYSDRACTHSEVTLKTPQAPIRQYICTLGDTCVQCVVTCLCKSCIC